MFVFAKYCSTLNSLSKGWLLISETEATFGKRGFCQYNENETAYLEHVGRHFFSGYNHTIFCSSNNVVEHFSPISKFDRGFVFEGAGFAIGCHEVARLFKRSGKRHVGINAFCKSVPQYSFSVYKGSGWVLAKMPWLFRFFFAQIDPLYRWLCFDGAGFYDTFFNSKKILEKRKTRRLNEDIKQVYFQGIGRALWFVHCSNVAAIEQEIQKWPREYRASLWCGVGYSACYIGSYDRSVNVIRQLARACQGYYLYVAQGCVFAATARSRERYNDEYIDTCCELLAGSSQYEASQMCSRAESYLPRNGSLTVYKRWGQEVRCIAGRALDMRLQIHAV